MFSNELAYYIVFWVVGVVLYLHWSSMYWLCKIFKSQLDYILG